MISTKKSDETYTVTDFISNSHTDPNTYYNFSIKEYLNGTEYFITSIIYDYIDEIMENVVTVNLNPAEKNRYIYKPWLLAMDVYGSTESGYIIKILNNILHDNEFVLDSVKLIHPDNLSSILGNIYSANIKLLGYTNNKVKEDLYKDINGNIVW